MKSFTFHINKSGQWTLTLLVALVLSAGTLRAQQQTGISILDELIAEGDIAAADSALQKQIEILQKEEKFDLLAQYPYYVGRIARIGQNDDQAAQRAEAFVSDLEAKTDRPSVLRQAYLELGSFYGLLGKLTEAYESNQTAKEYALEMEPGGGEAVGTVENNLGVLARRMGNVSLAIKHHRKALEHFKDDPQTEKNNYFISYNNMGAMMWFSSKTDSALYFYDQALDLLEEMEPLPKNSYYRPANVLNNKAALYSISGRTTDALVTMQEAVKKYKQFLSSEATSDADRTGARQALFRSVENLGGVYKELGNYSKTRELLLYSYQQKQAYLDSESPELFKVQILLGQIELALKNYEQAQKYLEQGINHIERLPDEYLFWSADAHYSMGLLLDEQQNQQEAMPYFDRAQKLFEEAYGGNYDAFYLDFLANAALFNAENGNGEKARAQAQKTLEYVLKTHGENTLLAFKHRLNVASVYYELGRYQDALNQSRQSLTTLQQQHFQRQHLLDSVQVEFKKPDAMLIRAKAEYQLESNRDSTFLVGQLEYLDNALTILDKRRAMLSADDVNVQIANNAGLFDFIKKIALELYQKTGNNTYLDRVIQYHESSLYNRIRSRLNAQKAAQFAYVPDSIRSTETEIKAKISGALQQNDLNSYLEANADWEAFLERLKTAYPRYFVLRYGSVKQPPDYFVPANRTVIRYFFAGDNLYALLVEDDKKKLFELDFAPVANHISQLRAQPFNAKRTGTLLHDLYLNLWQPLESDIEHERVIIIPDGELFNLSFETLVSAPVTTFAGLAEKSLLASHPIAYNYSLYLLQQAKPESYEDDFIAFAPGFQHPLKQSYKLAAGDSLFWDQTYLSLLPQPFTVELAVKIKRLFGGNIYVGEESTEQQFTSAASNHQIIHIGTHAESNNLRPELSRLFFAKPTDDEAIENDNYLYAYEIYDYDLRSNLTLLTACATGKPQYQPGEGMISLAHAFNYAGSKSLVTALWNIDEQASSQIIDRFYRNLAAGQPKDVALQKAKLAYFTEARGRTVAPEYWAGLVVLGDASAIPVERAVPFWAWLVGGLILLAAGGYLWGKWSRE